MNTQKPTFITSLLSLACLLFSLITSSSAIANPPQMGLHGMLLFGSDQGLFASHLPMFHPPHHSQVVMSLRFKDPAVTQSIEQGLVADKNNEQAYWTIVPQPFDLTRLAPNSKKPITELTVDVVQGHFERGGKTQWKQQTVYLEKVMVFNQLSLEVKPNEHTKKPNATQQYFVINHSPQDKTQFLVKRINHRPDADQIVQLTGASFMADSLNADMFKANIVEAHAITIHSIKSAAANGIFADLAELKQAIDAQSKTPTIDIKQLYLELGELK